MIPTGHFGDGGNGSRQRILTSAIRHRGGLSGRDRLPLGCGTFIGKWDGIMTNRNSDNDSHDRYRDRDFQTDPLHTVVKTITGI